MAWAGSEMARRDLFAGVSALAALHALGSVSPVDVLARDYVSAGEALDDLDRLASLCAMRLEAVRRDRHEADLLVSRFLSSLNEQRKTLDDVRRRFALPGPPDSPPVTEEIDSSLPDLRQALDDLMIGYAESLPAYGDAAVVSRLALDMVAVSRLRTVIDLWVVAEEV